MPGTVYDEFRAFVARRPEAIAVVRESDVHTYADVDRRVRRLADEIAAVTAPHTVVVSTCASTYAAAVTMLACAFGHWVYLPMDARTPLARQEKILAMAGPGCLVQERPGSADPSVVTMDEPGKTRLPGIAYAIFTSGSTGVPKGVLIGPQALVDRLAGLRAAMDFSANSSILGLTAPTFDISIAEMLLPLTSGGRLISRQSTIRSDPRAFWDTVRTARPNIVQATPTFWRFVLAAEPEPPAISQVWCGGEPLTGALAERLRAVGERVHNFYGPTEATIWATADEVLDGVTFRGAPLPGVLLALESELVTEQSRAPAQELLLLGSGLGEGYLQDEALTAERFPLVTLHGVRRRAYRTGDLAERRNDGTLRLIGRADSQIKLRGHRVELGDVEAALERHPDVIECACIVDGGEGSSGTEQHLRMFYRCDRSIARRSLVSWMRGELPDYMVPRFFEGLPHLPRNSAGKIDRAALRCRPDGDVAHFVTPATETTP